MNTLKLFIRDLNTYTDKKFEVEAGADHEELLDEIFLWNNGHDFEMVDYWTDDNSDLNSTFLSLNGANYYNLEKLINCWNLVNEYEHELNAIDYLIDEGLDLDEIEEALENGEVFTVDGANFWDCFHGFLTDYLGKTEAEADMMLDFASDKEYIMNRLSIEYNITVNETYNSCEFIFRPY
jgi:hypothetical protein